MLGRRNRPDNRPIPAHPYRDTALVYGGMAVVLVIVAWLTGGNALRATLAAAIFFSLATAWSWLRFRKRIRQQAAAEAAARAAGARAGAGVSANGNGRGGVL